MNLSKQHKELIEEIIRQNPAYRGHENLMDKFCSEVYKKSYLLLDSVSNIDSLKNYLTKVADTSIANVIQSTPKNEIKQRSVVNTNKPPKETKSASLFEAKPLTPNRYDELINSLPDVKPVQIQSAPPKALEPSRSEVISLKRTPLEHSRPVDYSALIDPLEFFPRKAPNEALSESIVEALKKIHFKNPSKKFMQIFTLRYVQDVHQSNIARRLKISQADLSKRFCELTKLIQQELV